jgi:hypothetical protein
LNQSSQWVITEVPQLRIVPDGLWQAAKHRQQQVRQTVASAGNTGRAQRPLHLFSGLIRCGECGSNYVVYSAHRLACSGRRERGICGNRLTMRRDELEARVLNALQKRFFESGPFQVFCEEFTTAVNEVRMELRAATAVAVRERAAVAQQIAKLIQAIKDGVPGAEVKDEMIALQARKAALEAERAAANTLPPLLHPNMAELWRAEITELRDALTEDRSNPEARQAVRDMVSEIRLTPLDGVLAVDVKGNLAAMLAAASPGEDWQRQITLVAGACNQRYLQLWLVAA